MESTLQSICFYSKDKKEISKINISTYVSTENMLPNKGGIQEANTLPNARSVLLFKKCDTLVSNIRPYFKKIWYATFDGGCSNDVLVFRANSNVDSKFLYYLLANDDFFKYAMQTSKGTKMPRGDKEAIMQYKINLPSLITQRKIASILSAIDDKIELNNRMNENLEEIMSQSFIHDYTEKIEIHNEWIKVNLGSLTDKFATGLNPRKNFVLGEGKNYYVTIKNMGNNRIYLDDKCDKVTDEALVKINNRSDLKMHDCLFSGIGTIGRVYLIDKPVRNWNISESIFTIRASKKITPEFLYLLLRSNDMQNYAISNASGSVQKGIRMADLKKYEVYVPDEATLKSLSLFWSNIINQIRKNEDECDKLAQLRDTLLPKLMSGEIDVDAIKL